MNERDPQPQHLRLERDPRFGPDLRCLHCDEPLKLVEGKGYVHQDGELYRRREELCPRCGGKPWRRDGPSLICRMCKGAQTIWTDDHIALPRGC